MLSSQPNTGGEHGRVGGNFDQVDPATGSGSGECLLEFPCVVDPFRMRPEGSCEGAEIRVDEVGP